MIFPILWGTAVLVGVYGAIDAAVRPWDHWRQTGEDKAKWVFAQLLVFIPIAGFAAVVAAILYLVIIRRKLKAVAAGLPTP